MIRIEDATAAGIGVLKDRMKSLSGSFSYDETAYHLPVSFALTGINVEDALGARDAFTRSQDNVLVAVESLVALQETKEKVKEPYTGFIPDVFLRKLGYSLVDGSILGLALIVGRPTRSDMMTSLCRELQEKYMLTFLAGESVTALKEDRVKIGLEYRLVPLGRDALAGIHFVDIIARVALIFGGIMPGDAGRLITYAKERARAFVLAFPNLSPRRSLLSMRCRYWGYPSSQSEMDMREVPGFPCRFLRRFPVGWN